MARNAVAKNELPAIGLKPRARLRAVGNPLPVRRVTREVIGRGIGRDLPAFAGLQVHLIYVMIGEPGLLANGNRRGCVSEFPAVGREREVVARRERRRGRDRIAIAGREVARVICRRAVFDGHNEEVLPLIVHPTVPMPVEQTCDDARFDFVLFTLVEFLFVQIVALPERLV